MTSTIHWSDALYFGSDHKSTGYYEVAGKAGTFSIRFRHASDGRCISLRHGEEFAGCFKTVAAAKRRAVQMTKHLFHGIKN
jgi:hypothetical protein